MRCRRFPRKGCLPKHAGAHPWSEPSRPSGFARAPPRCCRAQPTPLIWTSPDFVEACHTRVAIFAICSLSGVKRWRFTPQTDELLDEVKSLQLQIRSLPRRVRDWGVYKAVDEKVVNMSTVLPLVSEAVAISTEHRSSTPMGMVLSNLCPISKDGQANGGGGGGVRSDQGITKLREWYDPMTQDQDTCRWTAMIRGSCSGGHWRR